MKLRHIIFDLFVGGSAALCSCELETYDNGNLDGLWMLTNVDTLATSGSMNMDGSRLYWAFQGKLLQMEDKNGTSMKLLLRFEHKDDSLKLYDPYIYDRENGDKPLTDIELLAPYGINSLEEKCGVEHLNGNRMILNTPTLRLSFKKL